MPRRLGLSLLLVLCLTPLAQAQLVVIDPADIAADAGGKRLASALLDRLGRTPFQRRTQ